MRPPGWLNKHATVQLGWPGHPPLARAATLCQGSGAHL